MPITTTATFHVIIWLTLKVILTNSVDPDQTVPLGPDWSGSSLSAKIVWKVCKKMQQMRQTDNTFRCSFTWQPKGQNSTLEFMPFGVIVPRICIQDVSFKNLFQLLETFSIGINEKSWMVCPGELKCSETLVNISGKCTMSNLWLFMRLAHFWWVCPTYWALHFLHVIKYITSVEVHERFCFILCTYDVVVLVKQSDSWIVEQWEQRRLSHLVTL